MDDEKISGDQADDQARESEAAELQAQIDELISGKADPAANQPKTLRDFTRVGRKHSVPTPAKGSDKPERNNDSEVKDD